MGILRSGSKIGAVSLVGPQVGPIMQAPYLMVLNPVSAPLPPSPLPLLRSVHRVCYKNELRLLSLAS